MKGRIGLKMVEAGRRGNFGVVEAVEAEAAHLLRRRLHRRRHRRHHRRLYRRLRRALDRPPYFVEVSGDVVSLVSDIHHDGFGVELHIVRTEEVFLA